MTSVLKKRFSDRLGNTLWHLLPEKLAPKAFKTFGLKTPAHPPALAESIVQLAGILSKSLDELVSVVVAKFPDEVEPVGTDGVGVVCMSEILCALYAQAVIVLGSSVPQDEQIFFQIYTARSFEELVALLPEGAAAATQELIHEASNLYFNDSPTLTELAQQLSDYVLMSEVKKAQDMNSWTVTFVKKVEIRILALLGVKARNLIVHLSFTDYVARFFLRSLNFFKTIRPVLEGLE